MSKLYVSTQQKLRMYLRSIAYPLQSFCSIPELMPNKYRHVGLVIAELFNNACLIVGPIVGRVSGLAS